MIPLTGVIDLKHVGVHPLFSRLANGQGHGNACTASIGMIDQHRATMGSCCRTDHHHSQTDAKAAIFQAGLATESGVNISADLIGHAVSAILYSQQQHVIFAAELGMDRTSLLGEFHSIGNNVMNSPFQLFLISEAEHILLEILKMQLYTGINCEVS